jgi:hypothetical protein
LEEKPDKLPARRRGVSGQTFPRMIKGQRVVCINDDFPSIAKAIYNALPVKGKTYTIREVFLGREKVLKSGDSATVGLLLVELINPPDPLHKGQQELGFNSERFAPLEELPPEEAEEEARELVGAGKKTGVFLPDGPNPGEFGNN